ncbi:MAG: hypothetical protein H7246_15695 [Phycisphaerae bacterium]|nr:hypothetical protein [Saprospiraceae bacterium]
MKTNLYTAMLVLASTFVFSYISNAQTPFVSDSLSVYWEQLDGPPGYVFKYAEGGGKLFAGTERGLYYSSDGGKNWKFNRKLDKHKLMNIFVKDNVVFVLARRQVAYVYANSIGKEPLQCYALRSTNGGETWAMVFDTENWPGQSFYAHEPKGTDIVFKGDSSLYLCISTGGRSKIWTSQNLGETWQISTHDYRHYQGLLNVEGATAGVWSADDPIEWNGLLSTTDDFDDFQSIPMGGLPSFQVEVVRAAYQNSTFYVFFTDRSIYRTNNLGSTWELDTLHVSGTLKDIIWSEGEFFFHTTTGIWRGTMDMPFSHIKIYDGEGGTTSNALTFSKIQSGYSVNSNLLKSMQSTDLGQNWTELSRGLMSKIVNVSSLCGRLVARGTTDKEYAHPQYLSNTEDGEWTFNNHDILKALGEANGYSYIYGPPLMRSNDCWLTWDTLENAIIQASPEAIVQSGNRIYLWNKLGAPISFSDDNGLSWTEIQLPFDFADCLGFLASGDTLYFLNRFVNSWQLFRSFNIGQTWGVIPLAQNIDQISWNEKKQMVGLTEGNTEGKLFLSTDLGNTWNQTFNTSERYPYIPDFYIPRIRFPVINEGLILMQASNGLFASYNEGINWTRIQNLPFFNFTFDAASWYDIGGYTEGARFYHVYDSYLYAATESQGIWRTELAPIRDHALVKGGKYGFLQGRLYRDLDNTCDYNTSTGDVPLGHKPLTIQPGNITSVSDANGKYSLALPPGNYTVSASPPTYHTTNCTVGQSYTITAGNTTEANLIYQPQPDIKDLCILLTTPARPRPGFLVNYKVQVNNVGTAVVSGATLNVDFDAQWLEPTSIHPFGQFVGNQAIIPLPDLVSGQVLIFTLNFAVSVNTPLGTELSFIAQCPVSDDAHPANNRAAAIQTVTGSFDPNDKTAQPVQAQIPFQPRTFDYLIRFQNTGTDTAFTVIVTDTLDYRFDLMSLRTLESSHSFEFRLLKGRVAKWIFRDILLPDSNTNEIASHGYLRFQIETKPDALPGFAIPNDADIFFDFNSPVHTNESLAENPKWQVVNTASVQLCEGDTWNGSIWEQSTTVSDTTSDVWSDTISLTQITVSPTWNIQFDTTLTAGQILFGIPIQNDTTFVFEHETSEGCDSTLIWNVSALTSSLKDLQNHALNFEVFPNPSIQKAWLRATSLHSDEEITLKISLRDTNNRLWETRDGIEMLGAEAYELSLESLPSGIYFVEIQTYELNKTLKLVKI